MKRMRRALVLPVAVLAVSAPADLATAADGVAYGGATYRAPGHGDALLSTVALVRAPDGGLLARIGTGYVCGGVRGSNLFVRLTGRVGADGERFTLTRARRLRGGGRIRFTLSGRVTPTEATGIMRTRLSGLGRCPVPARKFVLRPGGLGPGAVTLPAAGALLGGTTAQEVRGTALPVALRAGKGGRTLTALWQAELRCGASDTVHRDNFSPTMRIAADGTFLRRERYTRRYRDGLVERYRVVFRGQVVAGGAVGSLQMTVNAHRGRTRFVPCRSGTIPWSARG